MRKRHENQRTDTAKILLLLASFSLRVKMYEKARVYTTVGLQLYPDDLEMFETHLFSLLILEKFDDVKSLLKDSDTESQNMSFIRARIAMLTSASQEKVAEHLKEYLRLVG